MKKVVLLFLIGGTFLLASIFGFTSAPTAELHSSTIKWYTLEEAIQAQQKEDKKIFIDMYTEWCGWCKVMDQKTFTDPSVIKYLNENFYAVKFDAEQKDPIYFKGKKYEFVAAGRRGIHRLAYDLVNGNASYPSFILLDENLTRFGIIKGYKTPEQLLPLLKEKNNL